MKNINPVYISLLIILCIVILFILYYAVDNIGTKIYTKKAVVIGKKQTAGLTKYINLIAGGRLWVKSQQQLDFYVISLDLGNEKTSALISEEKFNQLNESNTVQISYRRTRITNKIKVFEVLTPPR